MAEPSGESPLKLCLMLYSASILHVRHAGAPLEPPTKLLVTRAADKLHLTLEILLSDLQFVGKKRINQ
jgi:hypothetical protein